jgi:hypothetical protein
MTVLILGGLLMMSPGCASSNFATLKGAGDDFPRANYQIIGKTRYDQIWISKTIEAEVVGFGFKRPFRRPASFDARPASHAVVVTPAVAPTLTKAAVPAAVTVVPKKLHWWQRLKRKPI